MVILPTKLIGIKNPIILNVCFLSIFFTTTNNKQMPNKIREEKTIDDLMYNLNYAVNELKKNLRSRKKWEKIMNKKKKNERTNI